MAKFDLYFPTLVKWEGSVFENVPGDNGGPTKFGVILSEWRAKGYDKDGDKDVDVDDLKLITSEDAFSIAKSHYWDRLKGDEIKNQSVAELLVDFAYNCGVGLAAKKIQKLLGLTDDGSIGPQTLAKINSVNQQDLFNKLKQIRINYYIAIVNYNPKQQIFLKGWMARTNSFTFKP